MPIQTKWCPQCSEQRPISEFYEVKSRYDGLSPTCVYHHNLIVREASRKRRVAFIEEMGGKCERCGFDDWRALQVDHIDGGGNIDREIIGTKSRAYYAHVLANRSRYQLLCANCNVIKKIDQDETVGRRKYARKVPVQRISSGKPIGRPVGSKDKVPRRRRSK